jgi:hypothetical protein
MVSRDLTSIIAELIRVAHDDADQSRRVKALAILATYLKRGEDGTHTRAD